MKPTYHKKKQKLIDSHNLDAFQKYLRGRKKTQKYRKTKNDRIFFVENNTVWKIMDQHLKH